MKLTSSQFALFIATLCVVSGAAYRLGQRSVPRQPILSNALPATGVPARLRGVMGQSVNDLLNSTSPYFNHCHAGHLKIALFTSVKQSYAPGVVTLFQEPIRVRVVARSAGVCRVVVVEPGPHFNKTGYVSTYALLQDDGVKPFDPNYTADHPAFHGSMPYGVTNCFTVQY